jgi:hypothetical protein
VVFLRGLGLVYLTAFLVALHQNGALLGDDGLVRDTSDCHFRKPATEYGRKTGIQWLSCTEK